MSNLILTATALSALRSLADPSREWRSNAERRDDGQFDVEVDEEVAERLSQVRFLGETDSAVILRIVEQFKGGGVQ